MTISRPRTEAPRRRPPSPRLGRSGTRGARAAFLGTGPTAWYDARDLTSTTTQTLANRVGAGTATLGSTGTSDTNDPTALTHSGTSYVYFPAVASNFLVKPVSGFAAGEMTAVVDAEIDSNWNTGGQRRLISVDNGGHVMTLITGLSSEVRLWGSGASILSSGHPATGRVQWRIKRDGTTSASIAWRTDGVTSPTASGWTVSGSGAIGDGTTLGTNQVIGDSAGAGSTWGGKVYYAAGYDSGGTQKWVMDPNGTSVTQTTIDGFTVNRATSGLTTVVVTRPLLMADGTDDYLQLPAGDIPTFTPNTGSFTVMYVGIIHNVPAATAGILWSSESADNVGALMFATAGAATLFVRTGGSGTVDSTIGYTAGTRTAFAGVFSNGTSTAWTSTAGPDLTPGDYSAITGMTHGSAPRLFNRANATLNRPLGATWNALVQWNRALTATELTAASNYLLGDYS